MYKISYNQFLTLHYNQLLDDIQQSYKNLCTVIEETLILSSSYNFLPYEGTTLDYLRIVFNEEKQTLTLFTFKNDQPITITSINFIKNQAYLNDLYIEEGSIFLEILYEKIEYISNNELGFLSFNYMDNNYATIN